KKWKSLNTNLVVVTSWWMMMSYLIFMTNALVPKWCLVSISIHGGKRHRKKIRNC
ncbi:ATP-dependent helicase HrpA, partial [Vibrio parahaemolyticus EKP-008]